MNKKYRKLLVSAAIIFSSFSVLAEDTDSLVAELGQNASEEIRSEFIEKSSHFSLVELTTEDFESASDSLSENLLTSTDISFSESVITDTTITINADDELLLESLKSDVFSIR